MQFYVFAREMERQRQLEWETQKLQELTATRQKEQDNVLKLKARNQTLTIEHNGLVSKSLTYFNFKISIPF